MEGLALLLDERGMRGGYFSLKARCNEISVSSKTINSLAVPPDDEHLVDSDAAPPHSPARHISK